MIFKTTFLSAAAISASAVIYMAANNPISEKKTNDRTVDSESMTNAGGRAEWEISRMADPATGKIPENIRMM
ncbi:MAG: hypothetical protein M3R27_10025, partial [Bacteroidota bacterium]|nr:hypothetical protein [Bacteroidota bacterium]